MSVKSTPDPSASTLFARVSPEDILIFASESFADYIGIGKRQLFGSPLEVVQQRLRGELATAFARPLNGRSSSRLVTDPDGRVFQIRTSTQDGVLDLLLDEVTDVRAVINRFSASIGPGNVDLSEEEIQSLFQPERRLLSITQTRLCGYSTLAETAPPLEARFLASAFSEEAREALLENGASLGAVSPDEVQGIHGAPRHYRDHALRALKSVFEQFRLAGEFRSHTIRSSKEMPPLAAGISTGEILLSSITSSSGQRLAASGSAAALAGQLCRLARPGEILISEPTLRSILSELPPGWDYVRAESESLPDVSDVQWVGDEIQLLPTELERVVYLIGPGVAEKTEMVEIYLDYVYSLKVPGFEYSVPVLRAIRPESAGSNIQLSEDNIVAAPVVQVLGKYKLLGVVGQGGMGKVWKAQDRFANTVAVKVLHASEVSDAQVRRFRREAEIMARLQNRNICRVFEMDEYEGIHYIVMEYIDGLTLADLLYDGMDLRAGHGRARVAADLPGLIQSIRSSREEMTPEEIAEIDSRPRPNRSRILPLEQTLAIFFKICEAVQFAHEHGVLHRDLKPGNVLIREDGEPLVADFGLAKINSSEESATLSVSGHVVGTLENMAPEQAESSKDVDERADVYSLGTILYQMLTGRRHFEATGNIVTDAQHLRTHEPVRPRQYNSHLDSDLDLICLKALRNDPAERYRSVSALRADLDHFRKGEIISARPFTLWEIGRKLVQRNKGISVVVLFSVLLFTVGALLAFFQINERRIQAEHALTEAKVRTQEAEDARKMAERNEAAAQENEEKALAALQAKEQAEKQTRQAQEAAATAAEQSLKARQDAEKAVAMGKNQAAKFREHEKTLLQQIEELNQQKSPEVAAPAPPPLIPPVPPGPTPEERLEAARTAFTRAASVFSREFTPFELERSQREPAAVMAGINRCLDDVSRALQVSAGYPPALMLKGRLHMAFREWDDARSCFQRAKAGIQARPENAFGEDPDVLITLIDKVQQNPSSTDREFLTELQKSETHENRVTGGLIDFFLRSNGTRASVKNAIKRDPTMGEIALRLIEINPGDPPIIDFFTNDQNLAALRIQNGSALNDLTPLSSLSLGELDLQGLARTDWETLYAIKPEKITLRDCLTGPNPPSNPRGVAAVRELLIQGGDLASLEFLRSASLLERLSLSGTQVRDISPLSSRRLRILEIPDLMPTTMYSLQALPIETLVVSPELAADSTRTRPLRYHRTLKYIRTPADSAWQTSAEFWQKVDAGAYTNP